MPTDDHTGHKNKPTTVWFQLTTDFSGSGLSNFWPECAGCFKMRLRNEAPSEQPKRGRAVVTCVLRWTMTLLCLCCFCLQQWYTGSMKAVCIWLTDRLDLQLHMYQLKTLIKIVKVNHHQDTTNRPR